MLLCTLLAVSGAGRRPPSAATSSSAAVALAGPGGRATAPQPAWWTHAVIYEIYPRSFADTDGDGTGDLRGIIAHLDYLEWLGVDAIWITPCYPSPQVDFGYDIADYEAIDPRYGTLADFDALVREARRRHIRVLMDMVLNHTSDQHPWFIDSRSSRAAKHRDYYVWRDGRRVSQAGGSSPPNKETPGAPQNPAPPNNWASLFDGRPGSAWQYDPRTGLYYYHFYYPQQPDLNWRNPLVERDMFHAVRFWLERGVAGFRLDSVATLFEDPKLRDNPPGFIMTGDFPEPQQRHVYNENLPQVHRVLRDPRHLADRYSAVLVGETVGDDEVQLADYYGKQRDEIQLPFDFFFMDVNRLSAPQFRRRIAAWDHNLAGGTPDWFFDNHDQPREVDRYGDGTHNPQIERLLATLLLTLRGTSVLYYGQEIGMKTTDPVSIDQVKDPIGRRYWPHSKGRDGERTPMQWSEAPNAGFTTGTPWLPVPPTYHQINVADEIRDPKSLLNYYRALTALRREHAALREGSWASINSDDAHVLSFVRKSPRETVLVTLNLSDQPRMENFEQVGSRGTVLLASRGSRLRALDLREVRLEPFEALVALVGR